MIPLVILFAAIAYVMGSIPFSFIAGKLLRGIDLREHGSGNLGATNTYRMLGLGPALGVGVLDAVKGFIPVLLFPGLVASLQREQGLTAVFGTDPDMVLELVFALSAIAGHIWTLFLGFRGGKGVTTAFGAFLAIAPVATLVSLASWGLVLLLSRTVSIASITTAVLFPIYLLIFRQEVFSTERLLLLVSLAVSGLVVYTHRSNIVRILRGEEKKIKER
jgi:glycerol-3-phosphate acyltransferase PlsY